jgi:hypothetical protein
MSTELWTPLWESPYISMKKVPGIQFSQCIFSNPGQGFPNCSRHLEKMLAFPSLKCSNVQLINVAGGLGYWYKADKSA